MTTPAELLAELIESKYAILNNNFDADNAGSLLKNISSVLDSSTLCNSSIKSNIIKSFMVTFNVSNFSDLTVLFITSSDNIRIIEYAGSEFIFNEFESLIETEKYFYKDTDVIRVKGESFRVFYESMENASGIYTILTITESSFFKPSKFHMLCDILMDIIRSIDMSHDSVFNDLFEDTAVGINSYIADNNIIDPEFYLFKFENIYDFFLKTGLEIIIELSDMISNKLTEVFGDRSSIFRFSLSEYIVISKGSIPLDKRYSDPNNRNIADFSYKGIILQHRCIKIPYNNDKSIYDVFEKIFLINNNIFKQQ